MWKLAVLALVLICPAGFCQAEDAFSSVHCGLDIQKGLVGKTIPDERVVAIEERHQDLGLAHEGSMEISDSLAFSSWTICGSSYHILESGGAVTDAIAVDHSRTHPASLGACEVAGVATPYVVLAVVDTAAPPDPAQHFPANDGTLVPALHAWRIDEKHSKFAVMETAQLKCPRNGVFTADGGP